MNKNKLFFSRITANYWVLILSFAVYATVVLYIVGVYGLHLYDINVSVCAIAFVALIYSRFAQLLSREVIFCSGSWVTSYPRFNKNSKKWFCILFTPCLLYSIWFAVYMVSHAFLLAALFTMVIWMSFFCAYRQLNAF